MQEASKKEFASEPDSGAEDPSEREEPVAVSTDDELDRTNTMRSWAVVDADIATDEDVEDGDEISGRDSDS